MAKSHKKRRSGTFRPVRFKFDIPLSTLGSGVMLVGAIGIGTGQEHFALSADCSWTISDLTIGQGPIAVGLAHSDYTVAELDEWYEATATLTGDKIEQEEGRRLVRDVGIFAPENALNGRLNDGNPKRTKLMMRVEDTKTINVWARNMGASPLSTTNPNVRGFGKLYTLLK